MKKFANKQVSSKTIGNSSTSKPKVNGVNDKKTKSIIKRKSIKYNCKALKKTSLRRSLRKPSKKIYTVEDVPDDDLNIFGGHSCRHCGRMYSYPDYLEKHLKRCPMLVCTNPWECPRCGRKYSSEDYLNVQMKNECGKNPPLKRHSISYSIVISAESWMFKNIEYG
ncbi:zinc finger protein 383-like [Xenia sp. Carnegie-2017]|uniref:zinc finger protein 383-like n=1 Tax=Xenia sp. Carnegie-2017 TaxID=2897299 RepID=UPI001F03629C|nr:zinc finger protein 383-like [Xenia sp. Carnegie-2017]